MIPRLALAGLLVLAGCNSAPPVHLEPIPAPPPIMVPVPQYVPLPADATAPCQKPIARSIKTDVDLLNAAMAFKVYGDCNANKLQAIGEKQP
jgi:hypothetical protein